VDDLLWLDRIQASNRLQVGEKAFYLSQLRQKGYPIIPGFVIPSPVLRQFLETIEWLDPLFADLPSSSLYVDVENPYQLQQVAQRIRREMMAAALPETWESTLLAASKKLQAQGLILRPTLALLYLITFGSIVAYSAYTWLLLHVRPALATSYAYVNPPIAVLLGMLMLGEHVDSRMIGAMAVILFGVLIITRAKARA